jgi:hypothetical protein
VDRVKGAAEQGYFALTHKATNGQTVCLLREIFCPQAWKSSHAGQHKQTHAGSESQAGVAIIPPTKKFYEGFTNIWTINNITEVVNTTIVVIDTISNQKMVLPR